MTSRLIPAVIAFLIAACTTYDLPTPRPDWEAAMAHADMLHNVRLVGCDNYLGGSNLPSTDVAKAAQDGIACLASLGPKRRVDASRLAALFDARIEQRPVTIYCGSTGTETGEYSFGRHIIDKSEAARAYSPASPVFPGLEINLDSTFPNGSAYERRSLLLHEMTHWLGYLHTETFDVPYLAAACCYRNPMDKPISRADNLACNLLVDEPPFPSTTYFRRFAMASIKSQIPSSIVAQAAMKQAAAMHEASYLSAVVSVLYDSKNDPYVGAILSRAAGVKPAAPLSPFAEAIGNFLAGVIRGDRGDTFDLWAVVRAQAPAACTALSAGERLQIHRLTRISLFAVLDAAHRQTGCDARNRSGGPGLVPTGK
jgi:hypothetical protein